MASSGWRRMMRRRAAGCAAALLLALACGVASPTSAARPLSTVAAELLAATQGGQPSDFELVYELSTPGAAVAWAAKYLDRRTGRVLSVSREAGGALATGEAALQRTEDNHAALPALERKADTRLRAAAAGPASAQLPIAVWLEVDTAAAEAAIVSRHPELSWLAGRPLSDDLALQRSIRAELWDARRTVYAAAQAAVRPVIERLGGRVAYASTSAPLLMVDIPAGRVAEIAADARVSALGLEAGSRPTMSSAGPTIQADWTPGNGDQGTGVRVGVVEYHNVRATGDLSGRVVSSYSTTGSLAYAGSGTFDHPTWVAGAVASHDGTYRGVAPGAYIVSASTGGYVPSLTTDRAIIAAADWAISPQGGDADLLNASFGQDTSTGAEEARRYFDSVSYEDGRLVVAAAGNYVTFGHWDILSPATGYNVLTVGGIDDRGTASPSDDRIWFVPGSNGSNYRDPISAGWNAHGDYNKPNVSAPAVNVFTANGLGASGTSVATPIAAGVAAQLLARRPSLASWPEAMRAIITAGAIHRTRMPDGSLNADHEGAGTVNALWANRILEPGGGPLGGYDIGQVVNGATVSRQIQVQAGQRVRVSVAWSSHTSGSNLGKVDVLASDLDLRVLLPGGGGVGSFTFDNAYETVDFVAPASGTATIQLISERSDTGTEPYGLAWSLNSPFTDADFSQFSSDIIWAWQEGITVGCAATRYCPTATVTREQMASFLVRAMGLPSGGPDRFTDDEDSVHEGDINTLAASGVTKGCAPTRYCPADPVTRAQMASFLVRALGIPPSNANAFTDDAGSTHEADINALAAAGITSGCGSGRYCPDDPVTRGEMAAFLHRGFGSG